MCNILNMVSKLIQSVFTSMRAFCCITVSTYLPCVVVLPSNRRLPSAEGAASGMARVEVMNSAAGLKLAELRPAVWMRSSIVEILPTVSPFDHTLVVSAGARLEHFSNGT